MASLNWKQLFVAGLITVAGLTGAYYLLGPKHAGHASDSSTDQSAASNAASTHKGARKNKKKKKSQEAASASATSAGSQDSIVSDINTANVSVEKTLAELQGLCEKSSEELQNLNVDDKQKVFYALLLKGEALMNQGNFDESVNQFAKALALVPNPSEILQAFEKSLPEPIFTALLHNLQNEVISKTERYFETLAKPSDGHLVFEMLSEVDLLGKPVKRFAPKAGKDIAMGEVVYEDVPDSLAVTDCNTDVTSWCDRCLNTLYETTFACEHGDAVYCSAACQSADLNEYHHYVCKANPQAAEALAKLRKYCKEESRNCQALLLLRYVAMLLTEELKGNGTASSGPFVHYDHLSQMFPNASETDAKEAELLRSIFSTKNDSMADFLTDQIYASMKATLSRAAFSFSVHQSHLANNESHVEAFRKTIGPNQDCEATAFFPLSAHLPHSCAPSLALEVVPGAGCRVRAVAQKDIAAGEPLSIAFVPVKDMEREMRKEKLFLHFMIDCHCKECGKP